MPTRKPRVTITMTEEQFKAIEDYQYSNRKKNQTQAILALLEKGLADEEASTAEVSNAELIHIKKYRDLDDHGKKTVDFILDSEYGRVQSQKTVTIPFAARDGGVEELSVTQDQYDKSVEIANDLLGKIAPGGTDKTL